MSVYNNDGWKWALRMFHDLSCHETRVHFQLAQDQRCELGKTLLLLITKHYRCRDLNTKVAVLFPKMQWKFCVTGKTSITAKTKIRETNPTKKKNLLTMMCCGLQLVLWFHLLALLNLGSTSSLQGFIWRSADKVPAWKSEQLLVPCNWWHPLGACWSACKTKPLQTGVKCSWVYCRIKVAWSCHCFAWEQMID